MMHSRPLAVLFGSCILQACVAPAVQQTTHIEPVFQIHHSADKTATTYAQLGKYHQNRGNLVLARAAYVQSIGLDGRQLAARNGLAAIESQQGNLGDAVMLLQSVIADFPAIAQPYNNLGYVYYLQGNFTEAVKTLEKAVTLDAGNAHARNNLRWARAAEGSQAELAIIQRHLPQSPVTVVGGITAVALPAPKVPNFSAPVTPLSPPMEIVQLLPNLFELKPRTPVTTAEPRSRSVVVNTEVPVSSGQQTPVRATLRLEIANGNGIRGLALQVSKSLGRQGLVAARLSNALPFSQRVTEIQYRSGYEQQALLLQKAMHGHNFLMHMTTLTGGVDVRMVLGSDVTALVRVVEVLAEKVPT